MKRLFILAAPWLLAACEQLPELRYETEHLKVGLNYDAQLCQGNLDRMELALITAETALGVQLKKPVEVYMWLDENPGWCDETAVGCYNEGRRTIYATEGSIPHELVHAVVDRLGRPAAFWDEGAAEAISPRRTRRGTATPSSQLDRESLELSYNTAGHFSRWLIEREGVERFASMLAIRADARAAFEAVYDMSFDEAEALYLAEAPDSYGAYIPCQHPELEALSPTHWSEKLAIDCSLPHNYGGVFGGAVSTFRRFTVTQRGYYEIRTDSPGGALSRCPNENVEATPSLDDTATYGDFPPYTENWLKGFGRGFDGEEVTIFELTPGEYMISTGLLGEEPGQVQLEVELVGPTPGP